MRVGIGYDVHAFTQGRPLKIGGVTIPYAQGLVGHSDADVLIHAIIDALFGAAALGDIGRHFPDSKAQYEDIDSLKLLQEAGRRIEQAGYRISNIDTVVVAQAPKLAPYIEEMRQILSQTLEISLQDISVKATTSERLGFTGRQEGISAQAVALLHRPLHL